MLQYLCNTVNTASCTSASGCGQWCVMQALSSVRDCESILSSPLEPLDKSLVCIIEGLQSLCPCSQSPYNVFIPCSKT